MAWHGLDNGMRMTLFHRRGSQRMAVVQHAIVRADLLGDSPQEVADTWRDAWTAVASDVMSTDITFDRVEGHIYATGENFIAVADVIGGQGGDDLANGSASLCILETGETAPTEHSPSGVSAVRGRVYVPNGTTVGITDDPPAQWTLDWVDNVTSALATFRDAVHGPGQDNGKWCVLSERQANATSGAEVFAEVQNIRMSRRIATQRRRDDL